MARRLRCGKVLQHGWMSVRHALRRLSRPHRATGRHGLAAARAGPRRHARRAGAGPGAAAAVALDAVPASRPRARARAGRASTARRLPAAGARPAAPDVGRRHRGVARPAACRRTGDADQHDPHDRRKAGRQRAAGVRHRRAGDLRRGGRGHPRGAKHRLSRRRGRGGEAGAGRTAAAGGRADPHAAARPGAAVPLLGADRQRPSYPLRSRLRHPGRGLSGAGRARAVAGDAAGGARRSRRPAVRRRAASPIARGGRRSTIAS